MNEGGVNGMLSQRGLELYQQAMDAVDNSHTLEREDYIILMSKLMAHISAKFYADMKACDDELT